MNDKVNIQPSNALGVSQQTTLIEKYEEDYRSALETIDREIKKMIEQGREMAGLMQFGQQLSRISEVQEALTGLYTMIYNNKNVLEHFGSERLRQLGHEPKVIYELVKNADASEEDIENYVLSELKSVGFYKTHWFIKPRIVTEIEYMIETLKILIEPDFIPFDVASAEEDQDEKPSRYIPSSVKIGVWRRDGGKCVECGSKEKLEYDHIIPISKGGSNTERNIQLLCEKCNRKKAASIQ